MRLFAGTPWDQPPRCERCGKREAECACLPAPAKLTPPQEQTARLAVEKRSKGKVVTVVRGLAADANNLPALLTELKNTCGAGGSLHDDGLEIQGNHFVRIREALSNFGYRVKG